MSKKSVRQKRIDLVLLFAGAQTANRLCELCFKNGLWAPGTICIFVNLASMVAFIVELTK